MITRKRNFLLCPVAAAFLVLVLSACNGDVFVSGDESMEDLNFVIEGDDGVVTFTYNEKELKHIYVNYHSSAVQPLVYYNSKGDVISEDSPVKNIGAIRYHSEWLNYRLQLNGKTVTFTAMGNSSGLPAPVVVTLDYGYISKNINIEIKEGAAPEVVDVTYSQSIFSGETIMKTRSLLYTNNGDKPTTVTVNPYLWSQDIFLVSTEESWAKFKKVEMKIPRYDDGVWIYGDLQTVVLDASGYYSTNIDVEGIPVELGASQAVRITSVVTEEQGIANGTITFKNPVTKEEFTTVYTTTVLFPVDYDIIFEEVH